MELFHGFGIRIGGLRELKSDAERENIPTSYAEFLEQSICVPDLIQKVAKDDSDALIELEEISRNLKICIQALALLICPELKLHVAFTSLRKLNEDKPTDPFEESRSVADCMEEKNLFSTYRNVHSWITSLDEDIIRAQKYSARRGREVDGEPGAIISRYSKFVVFAECDD